LYSHAPIAGDWALDHARVVLPGTGGSRWEQLTFAAALRGAQPDVLFAPAYTAPVFTRVPLVLAVHDVSFLAHPEWFSRRERLRRRLLTRAAARRAGRILTLSEFSRGEIERRVGAAAERILVIRPGIDLPAPAPDLPRSTAERPTVLFVGTLLNRRHVPELVQAVALAANRIPGIALVIAGDNRTWPRQDPAALARTLGISSRVAVRAYVDEEELRRLYASASVFAFLSEYEGFGLTPLEALAAGVPPLVLDTPVSREVYRAAARYVERPDPDSIAGAIATLIQSADARSAVMAAAPAVLERYRWADSAAATLAALEEAAADRPGD
jgi:glycosyltransferase involved in cell wall biosynthesis